MLTISNPNQNFHFLDSFPKRHLGSCTRCVVCPFLRRPCLDIECWRKVGREVIRETKASTSQDNNRSRHGRRRPSEMEAMMIMMNRKRIVLLNICWHYNDFFIVSILVISLWFERRGRCIFRLAAVSSPDLNFGFLQKRERRGLISESIIDLIFVQRSKGWRQRKRFFPGLSPKVGV